MKVKLKLMLAYYYCCYYYFIPSQVKFFKRKKGSQKVLISFFKCKKIKLAIINFSANVITLIINLFGDNQWTCIRVGFWMLAMKTNGILLK